MAAAKKALRVLVAEDFAMVREGIRRIIDGELGLEVVGVTRNGEQACTLAEELKPDVVVMDFAMPKLDGAQATERLKETCPDARVLALTVHEDEEHLQKLLSAGVSGYVIKRAAAAELIRAIRVVAAGGTYLDPRIAKRVTRGFTQKQAARPPRSEQLTERETEVLKLLAWGFTNREVADRLNVSEKTVETHRARAMAKLGISSRAEIVRFAAGQGWMKAGASPPKPETRP